MVKTARLAAAIGLCIGVFGCARSAEIRQGPVYPEALPRTTTLDIHVIRRGQRIQMTNTTAQPFGEFTLWLNRRFSLRIPEGLAIGQTRTLNLNHFRDQYDERFRAGGFFATEKPEKIVLAELQSGDHLLSLVVVSGPEQP